LKTEIVYVLDRSGSMGSIWDDVFTGLNFFIKEQQKIKGECSFTLAVFDHEYEVLIDNQDINAVEPITDLNVSPRGSTALLDAIGLTIIRVSERIKKLEVEPDKIIFIIATDGKENSSHLYSRDYVKELIARYSADTDKGNNWEFIFTAVGIDAFTEMSAIGATPERSASFTRTQAGVKDLYATTSDTVADYRKDD